jgi:hypothetical protein
VKRSGGVTAAAVMLIVAGVLVTFGAFIAALTTVGLQTVKVAPHVFGRQVAWSIVVLLVAIWGVATGVGLLRLRLWAWYCVLLISAVLVADAIPGLIHARKLIRATTGVPTVSAGGFIMFDYIGVAIVTLIPLALGLWWLLLFTRRSMREQFAPGATLDTVQPPRAFVPPAPPLASSSQFTSRGMQLPYRRPVSITVIAIFLLAGAAAFPLFLFYPASWRVIALFGVVLTGRAVLVVLATYSALGILLGVGLLLLKPWARMGAIVCAVAVTVNVAVSTRAQMRAFQMLQSAMGMSALPGNGAQMFQRMMQVSMIFGVVFSVAVNFVALYFLVTRRGAFYAPRPGAPASPGGAANPAAPAGALE